MYDHCERIIISGLFHLSLYEDNETLISHTLNNYNYRTKFNVADIINIEKITNSLFKNKRYGNNYRFILLCSDIIMVRDFVSA